MVIENILLFGILGVVVVGSAVAMLFSRNAVYSALFLALNFTAVAVLYLTLGAPFIALAQITVYAGAIMVLFLFVIMMLGAERLVSRDPIRGQRWLAVILAGVLLVQVGMLVIMNLKDMTPLRVPPADFANPASIGNEMFAAYTLPFEITSIILFVSLIGAILLTRKEKTARQELAEAQQKSQKGTG
jgi:NADH-quinone oxidoreductase subunit J